MDATDRRAAASTTTGGTSARVQRRILLDFAVAGGVLLAVIGVIDGIIMIANRHITDCGTGDDSPGNCYVHPQASIGVAVVVGSLLFGLVVGLIGAMAGWILDAQAPTAGDQLP